MGGCAQRHYRWRWGRRGLPRFFSEGRTSDFADVGNMEFSNVGDARGLLCFASPRVGEAGRFEARA